MDLYSRNVNQWHWHSWFAWRPVPVDSWNISTSKGKIHVTKKVWLKKVLRKRVSSWAYDWWIYKEIENG